MVSNTWSAQWEDELLCVWVWVRWDGRRARRERGGCWVEIRWRNAGEERVALRHLQTHLETMISRRVKWEKIWWRVSWGRRFRGENSIAGVRRRTAAAVVGEIDWRISCKGLCFVCMPKKKERGFLVLLTALSHCIWQWWWVSVFFFLLILFLYYMHLPNWINKLLQFAIDLITWRTKVES